MKIGRNDPCPCGSGRKNKNCCQRTETGSDRKWTIVGIILLVLVVGGAIAALLDASKGEYEPPPGRVWSEEHGHWHNAQPQPAGTAGTATPGTPPAGKVWSEEHGHWHDAAKVDAQADPPPPPEADPGDPGYTDPGSGEDPE